MNESTTLNEPTSVTERTDSQSKLPEFGIPLPRHQTVLILGLLVIVAVILWRRRANRNRSPEREDTLDSETVENSQFEESDGETIYVPQDPDDELEKDAVVLEALRSRGKLGGE